jgi:hypothetical protein
MRNSKIFDMLLLNHYLFYSVLTLVIFSHQLLTNSIKQRRLSWEAESLLSYSRNSLYFYGTRNSTSFFLQEPATDPYLRWIHSVPSHLTSLRSNSSLSSHLQFSYIKVLFHSLLCFCWGGGVTFSQPPIWSRLLSVTACLIYWQVPSIFGSIVL